jgi:2-methylcitrate dehydratase PrpD
MPSADGLTAYVANFAANTRFEDIPPDVMRLGKKAILDVLGPALAGSVSHTSEIMRRYLQRQHATGEASVLGTDMRLPARFAALANGLSMHVDDFDDTLQGAPGKYAGIHPTTPMLAALLAASETDEGGDRSGRALLTAFHIGVEIACKLYDATTPAHVLNGFHSTGSVAGIAAAIAVARLRGASVDTIRTAIGISASQAAGLSSNFGTMTKSLHAGRSAETALMAADLAADGFTATQTILETPRGYFHAYGDGWERERIEGHLGSPWSFVDRGIWLKPWPTGSLSHPAMTLFLDLARNNNINPENVTRIRLRTSRNIYDLLQHHRPKTELQAKFSLEFCIAAMIQHRALRLQDFTDEFVASAALQRLIEKVEYSPFTDAEMQASGYTIVTTLGEIDCADGTTLSDRRDYGKGSKANPMTDEEVGTKFLDCADFCHWPKDKAQRAVQLINTLEQVSDVRELIRCLTNGATPSR